MSALDVSRHQSQPQKHYAGGRFQQGRLLTDADSNESALQSAEDLRLSLLGLTGRGRSSSHMSPDEGFAIGAPIDLTAEDLPEQSDRLEPGDGVAAELFLLGGESTYVRPVSIRAGTFYLGGMRFELEQTEPFMFQRDFLQMSAIDVPIRDQGNYAGPFSQLYFLEAWEQTVSAIEDHEFLEKALGGLDTGGRVRRMRRVRAFVAEGLTPKSCQEMWVELEKFLENPLFERNGTLDLVTGEFRPNARLRLNYVPELDFTGCKDCSPAQGTRFLGADNQTLRILCTRSNRFVWGFDNSAPLYRVTVSGLGSTDPDARIRVTLRSPLKDPAHAPRVGRVVEIIPFAALLAGDRLPGPVIDPHYNKVADEVGAFSRVVESYDPATGSFVLAKDADGIAQMRDFVHTWDERHPGIEQLFVPFDGSEPPDERHFFMRLWHEAASNDEIELPAQRNPSQPLGNTGYFPEFLADVPGERGNSWTVALRPEAPLKVRPIRFFQAAGMPPDGPRHFFAPLAFLRGDQNQVIENADCRPILRPITDVDCVTFTVGDGKLVKGEFTSIQEAIDTLPEEGGTVLVRPGVYRERILIEGRNNVSLVGCGDRTVLESIPGSDVGILRISGGGDIRVSGFKLHVANERGVSVQGSSGVTIADLDVKAGFHDLEGTFIVTSFGNIDDALIRGEAVTNLAIGGLVLSVGRRGALELEDCPGFLIDNVDASSPADAPIPPDLPMVALAGCRAGAVRNVSFKAFGQFGIVTDEDCRDLEIERVAAECGANIDAVGIFARRAQAKPALDIDGKRIHVKDSRVLMLAGSPSTHAGVVVKGDDIEVSGSHVECVIGGTGPGAFGGIQIRGQSTRITLRNNHLIGGIGHGVTLGSVLWNPTTGEGGQRREGAGEDQMPQAPNGSHFVIHGVISQFSDGTRQYLVEDEGPLRDITIVGNRIEEFSTNGISSLTVFGLGQSANGIPDYILIERLRIEENHIQRNVRRPYETPAHDHMFPFVPVIGVNPRSPYVAFTSVLPHGGIVIGHVNQVDIRGNLVSEHGQFTTSVRPIVPISGIYVADGESISICKNVVTYNGVRPSPDNQARELDPVTGMRAGIAVLLAGAGTPQNHQTMLDTFVAGGDTLRSDGQSLRVSDNIVRQIDGRALHVVATGPVQVDGNFLSTEGFHGSDTGHQDNHAVGDVVFIQNLGGPWERFDVAETNHTDGGATSDGDFTDYDTPRDAVVYLFNQVPSSPRHFVGLGGQVLFQNNQVVYDWQVRRTPRSSANPLTTFAVAIMSLDHTSVSANQFALRVLTPQGYSPPAGDPDMGSDEPFFAHVLATGGTLEAVSNRVSEHADQARFSLLGLGELAFNVVHNQTTHEVWATGANPRASYGNLDENQEMLLKRAAFVVNSNWVFHLGVRLFMKLLDRPYGPLPFLFYGPPPPPPGS